ncbi:hypothetical protein E2C01_068974 [Portunus trituberculatus]|uniref:Uncharacterized protein n=1 Tax=Portunus trituberculatus TaxID=210409 RepID=A0A5B7I0Y7_PORTR|nr:hypothetical protein [Portunus trituberculatus]
MKVPRQFFQSLMKISVVKRDPWAAQRVGRWLPHLTVFRSCTLNADKATEVPTISLGTVSGEHLSSFAIKSATMEPNWLTRSLGDGPAELTSRG